MTRRRPDNTTVINTGQRLILNREGLDELVNAAVQARLEHTDDDRTWGYLRGIGDVLEWLLGEEPTLTLRDLFDLDPTPARRHP